jgi:hypothetical protein
MFDLELYRNLDHASRRLFLLLQKQFYRSQFSQWFDVRQLASQQLGFDETQPLKNLKQKVFGCIRKLQQHSVLAASEVPSKLVEKIEKGRYRIRFERGQRFSRSKLSRWNAVLPAHRQAVASQLHRIGLEDKTIGWVFRSYKPKAITEWAEITIARMERKLGFAKTPAAFLMHHLKEASAGKLTPPDWWLDLKNVDGGEKVWRLAVGKCSALVCGTTLRSVAGGSRRGLVRLSQTSVCYFVVVAVVLERDVRFRRLAS